MVWDLRGCDIACKATWLCHADPRERLHGVDVARTRGRATQAHADAWVAPTWHETFGFASDGPTSIVGPGNSIGEVTQM